jgi:hypothetical protein
VLRKTVGPKREEGGGVGRRRILRNEQLRD